MLSNRPEGNELNQEEKARYSRHILLPEFGVAGQQKLKAARVLIVGMGGLGSPAALYLAAAGIGTLGLVDYDQVDATNLQRQILHGTDDQGRTKTDSAHDAIRRLNPHVITERHATALSAANALDLVASYDVILDGCDNFATRYLLNDACVLLGKPNVHGSVFRFEGQASVFWAEHGPCYRCLYPAAPPAGLVPSCAEGGVLGVLPGLIGMIQATETIKLLTGIGTSLTGRLLLYNALDMSFRELQFAKDPDCPICSKHPRITELADMPDAGGSQAAESDSIAHVPEMEPEEVKANLASDRPPLILDVRQPFETDICRLPDSKEIPLSDLQRRMDELDPESAIVVLCHSGQRSAAATQVLIEAGFQHVHNLRGGITAWAKRIDPSMPIY